MIIVNFIRDLLVLSFGIKVVDLISSLLNSFPEAPVSWPIKICISYLR